MKIEHNIKKDEVIAKAYSFLNSLPGTTLSPNIKIKNIQKNWERDDFRFVLNIKKGDVLELHIDGIMNFYDKKVELNFSFPAALQEYKEKIIEILISKFEEKIK